MSLTKLKLITTSPLNEDEYVALISKKKKEHIYEFLRLCLPYVIEYNEDEYYFIDRNYVYMGTEKRSIETDKKLKRIYLFNDNTKPFDSISLYYKYIRNLNKIQEELNLKNCKSETPFVSFIKKN